MFEVSIPANCAASALDEQARNGLARQRAPQKCLEEHDDDGHGAQHQKTCGEMAARTGNRGAFVAREIGQGRTFSSTRAALPRG